MPIPLPPTFLHFLGYFSHLRCPSNSSFLILPSLVTPLIHPNILISAIFNFFSCACLHCPRLGTVYHCQSYNCLVYFPLDSITYSSVAQNPCYPLPVFPSRLYSICVISVSKSPFSANVATRYLNVFIRSKFFIPQAKFFIPSDPIIVPFNVFEQFFLKQLGVSSIKELIDNID